MIEQHVPLGERVGVRRHVAAVLQERAVARALAHIAEDLIVRSVFAHNVDDVVDQ